MKEECINTVQYKRIQLSKSLFYFVITILLVFEFPTVALHTIVVGDGCEHMPDSMVESQVVTVFIKSLDVEVGPKDEDTKAGGQFTPVISHGHLVPINYFQNHSRQSINGQG